MTSRQEADAIARDPNFWPNYQPPANHVLAAIQRPLDERWQSGVLNAVLKDSRKQAAQN